MVSEENQADALASIVYRVNNPKYGDYGTHRETADAILREGWRPPQSGKVFLPGDVVPAGVTVVALIDQRVQVMREAAWSWQTTHACVELPYPTPEEWQAMVDRANVARGSGGQK